MDLNNKIRKLSVYILLNIAITGAVCGQTANNKSSGSATRSESQGPKYGALAIDRGNGYYFAFSTGASSLTEAVKTAIAECKKKGGKCTLVLSYSGEGCVAYRTSAGQNVGLAYGWGIAKTTDEADAIAKKECNDRTFGMKVPNLATSCNDANSGVLNVIYNASREIDYLMGIQVDY